LTFFAGAGKDIGQGIFARVFRIFACNYWRTEDTEEECKYKTFGSAFVGSSPKDSL
jgi:hypothetical protein